ncbi:alpha/beta hydrolase [Actinomadura sp. ATCC 31491]|uniref:Alpha/beta hydrolase n=1 Tax=Actinomadura luzonensis TaxID=2805427 RepID=A0ABT0G788_9ACTN|nr:alpha/beta hydrolase [Actinomadura luzonensis]MCK2220463.1 alpha/beta hydrolase [Actinomadura luzonensis]
MTHVRIESDIEYAKADGVSLALDLYLPTVDGPAPVVLYLHGGGWQVGDKRDGATERLELLASYGVAVASANYRFAAQATYPAQLHDVKAAVRWLRANGRRYGLAVEKIGAWGASAGAYLASMIGLTAKNVELEGSVGDHPDQPSHVDAVVHWFGQSDLWANSRRTWLEKEILNPPFEGPLLGLGDVSENPAAARATSPLTWASADAPPFLIAHGDRDRVTPAAESLALHDALVRAGAQSTMMLLGGAGHEGEEFDRPGHLRLTAAFLLSHLGDAR